MKACGNCRTLNPGEASYCMKCGRLLPEEAQPPAERQSTAGFGVFGLSLLGSLVLSFVLIYVFKLPVFLLFGFLPLLWWRRKG